MSKWRDISTAPRDGTEIIIEDADGVNVGAGFWADNASLSEAGWFWEGDRAGLQGAQRVNAVRWQPFPDALALVIRKKGEEIAGRSRSDPVFAAIRAVNLARITHTQALAGLDEDNEAAVRRANEACDRYGQASMDLIMLYPATWDGFRELVNHYAEEAPIYGYGNDFLYHLRDIVEGSSSAEAFPSWYGGEP